MKNLAWCCLAALVLSSGSAQSAEPSGEKSTGPLGSAKFMPTPDKPYGWRGDGSGRYPGATPPTKWERRKSGGGYAASGIVYAVPLPNGGVSCPIIVGNRVYLTVEPSDLMCLDKASGQILWIRSSLAFEGMSAEDRKANPDIDAKLAPMLPQLAKANQDVADAMNGHIATGATAGAKPATGAVQKKKDLEKQINDQSVAINKKLFSGNWAQAVFGYAGPTPVSDGKRLYAFFTTGISVCYDLDGTRKWINRGSGDGSEHGNFASPILGMNRLVVWANEMRAYETETGKLAWTAQAKSFNTYGSMFKVQAGGELVAAFQSGYFARIRDGQRIWGDQAFGDSVQTPIVEGGLIFARQGYPIAQGESGSFKAFKIPAGAEGGGKPSPSHSFKMEWAEDEIPVDKKKNPFDRGFVASPLLADGLIYNVTEGGGLFCNDAATGELVYKKVLPVKPKTEYWNWAGMSASPTQAGKYIYLMDNQGLTIVIQAGRVYKEVSQNMLEESRDGKSQEQNVSTPIFEGTRMYYRTPGYLYCIGT
ncbi:MAG TPA: PQQ-binding-like beta-propeller repeat protein [Planctomycetota bacterium]|nr:PQQ-binding-like beta-propeller repeat protein [Planctomycetota bacterium]